MFLFTVRDNAFYVNEMLPFFKISSFSAANKDQEINRTKEGRTYGSLFKSLEKKKKKKNETLHHLASNIL